MRTVHVKLNTSSYPIFIKRNLLDQVGVIAKKYLAGQLVALVTDDNVKKLYAERVAENVESAGFHVKILSVPAGESSKSLSVMENLFSDLIKAGFNRKSAVIALGGGVVGDLAGFLAATFMRGIQYVQIPTTLLAQTDSSVGGKVAVNHHLGKNLIGVFYQPDFVFIDPLVLRTLDKREINAGLGEVIKYGLIRDKELFEKLINSINSLQNLDYDLLEFVIARCCEIKAEIVEQDEKESGLRRILNYGHTIGHALEAATNFNFFRHGEAVILGMRAMNWLSHQEGLLTIDDYLKAQKLLEKIKIPDISKNMSAEKILSKVYYDKKNIEGQLCVVLLNGIGNALVQENFSADKLLAAIHYLLENQ